MKKVIVRRLKNNQIIEEVFFGKEVNWAFDVGVFRVWDTSKTLGVPYQMLESVEIVIDPHS